MHGLSRGESARRAAGFWNARGTSVAAGRSTWADCSHSRYKARQASTSLMMVLQGIACIRRRASITLLSTLPHRLPVGRDRRQG
jgi:hypothetical protein